MEQELNQEGAVEETPKEEISAEALKATSTEEKATSQRTEEEFRKLQSMKDKAEAQFKSVQQELQELRKEREQQMLESRKRELEALADDPEGQSTARRKHQLEDEVRRLEQRRAEEEGAVQRKYDQAAELAKQYELSLQDARELLDATSPKEMELMAKLKATERGKTPSKTPNSGFKPDSGTSDAGGRRTWTREDISIMSPEEYKKNYTEIQEAIRAGRVK